MLNHPAVATIGTLGITGHSSITALTAITTEHYEKTQKVFQNESTLVQGAAAISVAAVEKKNIHIVEFI